MLEAEERGQLEQFDLAEVMHAQGINIRYLGVQFLFLSILGRFLLT